MWQQLFSIFLKSHCAACQRPTTKVFCQYCQSKLNSQKFSNSSRLVSASEVPIFAWGKYDGQLKRAIALMKYQDHPEIGEILGHLLGQAWLENGEMRCLRLAPRCAASPLGQSHLTVVPIPLHPKKLKQRGFNQAEIIARSFCRVTAQSLNTQLLMRIRDTEAMFNLENAAERAKNLQGALKVGNKMPKSSILLIDDIHTTGTTVKESVKVLQQKQIEVIGVAVVAKAGLLHPK